MYDSYFKHGFNLRHPHTSQIYMYIMRHQICYFTVIFSEHEFPRNVSNTIMRARQIKPFFSFYLSIFLIFFSHVKIIYFIKISN